MNLCRCLYVPPSKRDDIRDHYPPTDHRRVLVDWWFSTDPTPSWRRLIQQLDCTFESKTADKIRHNAEPVEGMLCTYYASVRLRVALFTLLFELLAVLEEAQSFELGGCGPGKANICLLGLTH